MVIISDSVGGTRFKIVIFWFIAMYIFLFYIGLEITEIPMIILTISIFLGMIMMVIMFRTKIIIKNNIVRIPGFIPSFAKLNSYAIVGKNNQIQYKFHKDNIEKVELINSGELEHIKELKKKSGSLIKQITRKSFHNADYLQTIHITSKEVVCIKFKTPLNYTSSFFRSVGKKNFPVLEKIYVSVKDPEKLLMALQ